MESFELMMVVGKGTFGKVRTRVLIPQGQSQLYPLIPERAGDAGAETRYIAHLCHEGAHSSLPMR